jgi:dephospho-CoA kinase
MPTLRVGITGGIGSGKSTVCAMFEVLGVPVYYADDRAKALITDDPSLRKGIVALLGEKAYFPDGTYNRAFVASVVFADPEKLAALNALVHPAVERDSRLWHEDRAREGHAYTLKEAALLVEIGAHAYLDALIVVTAPEALRIQRVVQRDGVEVADVQARMARQLPEKDKVVLADYLVVNDGAHRLTPQVWNIHRQLTARAKGG